MIGKYNFWKIHIFLSLWQNININQLTKTHSFPSLWQNTQYKSTYEEKKAYFDWTSEFQSLSLGCVALGLWKDNTSRWGHMTERACSPHDRPETEKAAEAEAPTPFPLSPGSSFLDDLFSTVWRWSLSSRSSMQQNTINGFSKPPAERTGVVQFREQRKGNLERGAYEHLAETDWGSWGRQLEFPSEWFSWMSCPGLNFRVTLPISGTYMME